MCLADAGCAGEAEHRKRLVDPPRGDPAPQLVRDRLDRVGLADHPGADPRRQIVGIDGDEARGALFVSLLQAGLVGEPIENIHDEPRKIRRAVEEYGDGRDGCSDHQRNGQGG
jgi:hypothetical protein